MRFFIIGFIVFIFLMLPEASYGQPAGGGPAGGGPPSVPLSGIEYLIGAGLTLGIRHFLKRKKRAC